jgi:hypothetical protein
MGSATHLVQIFDNAANPATYNRWWDAHAAATWSHVFGPSLANELRAGMVQEDNFGAHVARQAVDNDRVRVRASPGQADVVDVAVTRSWIRTCPDRF